MQEKRDNSCSQTAKKGSETMLVAAMSGGSAPCLLESFYQPLVLEAGRGRRQHGQEALQHRRNGDLGAAGSTRCVVVLGLLQLLAPPHPQKI